MLYAVENMANQTYKMMGTVLESSNSGSDIGFSKGRKIVEHEVPV